MAKSFLNNEFNNGFWIHNNYVELTIYFINNSINEVENPPEWLIEYKDWLSLIQKGIFPGSIDLRISEFLNSKSRKDEFCLLIKKSKEQFQSNYLSLSIEFLNELEKSKPEDVRVNFYESIPSEKIIKCYDLLIRLIKNELTEIDKM